MAKIKRISINALENVMKETRKEATVIQWNGLEVVIKYRLSLVELLNFANAVAMSCFASDTNEYIPEAREFAIRSNVLDTYANFNLPKDPKQMYELVFGTDAYEFVLNYIDRGQFDELVSSIDKKLNVLSMKNVEAEMLRLSEAIESFEDLRDGIEDMLDSVDPRELSIISDAISDGTLTSEGIVNAYIKMQESGGEKDGIVGEDRPESSEGQD